MDLQESGKNSEITPEIPTEYNHSKKSGYCTLIIPLHMLDAMVWFSKVAITFAIHVLPSVDPSASTRAIPNGTIWAEFF
jgi:hypothetical protein